MPGRTGTAAALLGIALLGILVPVALMHAWADLLQVQASAISEGWGRTRQARGANAANTLALAKSRLLRADQLRPGDATIAQDLGRLHQLRSFALPGIDSAASAAELRQALEYYERSVRVRPTSPYMWGNIAIMHSGLGLLDAGLVRAIDNAALLGPWEPEVQIALADIGFSNWNALPQASRDTIQKNLYRGLKHNDAKMFDSAFRHARLDVMCATPGVTRSKLALRCI